jgi:hypothetical protein
MKSVAAVLLLVAGIGFGRMLARRGVVAVPVAAAAIETTAVEAEEIPYAALALSTLEAQYIRAIEDHYIPAKRAAEQGGSWYRVYEVARIINLSCALRASWTPAQLEASSIVEPVPVPGMPIDWRKKAVTAGRELTGCIQIVRSERKGL